MILPDVNVLIYAFRSDSERHDEYKAWLESEVNDSPAYGIAPQVLSAVIRVCTHRRFFARPSSLKDVFAFSSLLLEQPNATVIMPGDRHWETFDRLCAESKATGNLVQDAWFAALAVESGCEWITTDRDYSRFAGLSCARRSRVRRSRAIRFMTREPSCRLCRQKPASRRSTPELGHRHRDRTTRAPV